MWRRRSLGGPGPRSVAYLSAARRIMGHFFTHNNDQSHTCTSCSYYYFDSTFPRAFYRSRARPPAPPRIYTSRYI